LVIVDVCTLDTQNMFPSTGNGCEALCTIIPNGRMKTF
jgi:hypothetical protein